MSKLVIVESPSKIKTIKKVLGSDFEVLATKGHIRDLPKSKMGVDIENNFQPEYTEMGDKKDTLNKLRAAAAASDTVYLATDPDREGEAISWHLSELLALDGAAENRVTFNEITKTGITQGMKNPRKIDIDLVDAQQARRILDRIVGYKLSPFLWKKVRRGLSAGRVQSVALRLIVDREDEIRAFNPVEYWSLDALLDKNGSKSFPSKLHSRAGEKKIEIGNEDSAFAILKELNGADYIVNKVKKGVRQKQPAPPFITSTLQQEASRKLGYTGQRTMSVAQKLYEGVEVPDLGITGLITYMRTDSLRISDEARAEGSAFIEASYGKNYLPESPRIFKSKNNSQDGHEAIRPTMPSLTPKQLEGSLAPDQYKIYKLIWERFIASQMANCIQDTVQADIAAGEYIFKSSGYTVRFDGFTVLYEEGRDEEDENNAALPPLTEGDRLNLLELTPNQHFTQPPARYTEPTLIKALEENGIGRPSTYAPTISTILNREYVEREKRSLKPTPLGEVITGLLKDLFADIVNVDFTAMMEEKLDEVEAGRLSYVDTLRHFYSPFEKTLEAAESKMDGERIKVPEQETDVLCENCGRNMVIKSGRFGKFLGCPGYPECKTTKPIVKETPGLCPLCGEKILEKKSKNGHKYFGCSAAPSCGFMTWDEPTAKLCESCSRTLFKKQRGGVLYCADEGCGYEAEAPKKAAKKAGTKTAAKAKAKTGTKTATKTKAKTGTKAAAKTTAKTTAKAKSTAAKSSAKSSAKATTAKAKPTAKKSGENAE